MLSKSSYLHDSCYFPDLPDELQQDQDDEPQYNDIDDLSSDDMQVNVYARKQSISQIDENDEINYVES